MAKKATTLHDNLGNDLLPVTNASITYMDDGNSVQAEINDLKLRTQYNKGHYTTEQDLLTAYPNGIQNPQSRKGWYAIVGSTDSVWIWDIEGNKWSDSGVSSGGVTSVNELDGEVILTGGNINATATVNETSKTELINSHLTDIYSELDNTVDLDSSQLITGTKVFTEVIGLANTSEGTVDQIKHINSNFLITSGTGQNLLNIDEGLETISAFNRELAYEDEIQQIQGDYATKDELSQEIQNVTDMIPTKVSELTNDSNYATVSQVNANTTLINDINSKIPNQASSTNQLADRDFVNSSLNSIVAFYITYNSNGDPFPTKSALINATTYYSGGQVRTPTKNDYAIVLQDESKGNATTRYIYYNQWEYQYTVNETALTADQLSAINSGITSTLVGKISSNETMLNSLAEQVATDYVNTTGNQSIGGVKNFTGELRYGGANVLTENDIQDNAVFVVDTYTQYTLWGNNDLKNGIYILKAGGIVYYGHGANATSSTYAHSCGAGSVLIYSRNVDFAGSSGSAYFKLFIQSKSVVVGATTYSSSTSRSIAFADGTSQLNKILQVTTATNVSSNVKTEATWQTPPTPNNGTLTLQQNGTTIGTFSANQSNNVTYNIETPKLVTLTQAEYDALATKDSNTYYFIKEE